MTEIKAISELIRDKQLLPGDEGDWLIPHEDVQKYDKEDLEELQAAMQREAVDRGLDLLFQYDIDYNQYRVNWRPKHSYCPIEVPYV